MSISVRWGVFLGVVLLTLLFSRSYIFFKTLPVYRNNQEIKLRGKVDSVPVISARSEKFIFKPDGGEKIYVTTSPYNEYYYGQRVNLQGVVKVVLLDERKSVLTISFPRIAEQKPSGIFGRLSQAFYLQSNWIRERVIVFYERNLPQNSAAFMGGVVLGVDSGMTKQYRDSLSQLGVVHVVAASGMNVAIVAGVFFSIFSKLFHRKVAVIFSIVAIAFYTVLAGGQASIIRAAIMGSIAFSAGLFGRQYFGLLALFVTAWVMLMISPLYIGDVGFQLSFLSTLGLLILPKLFERFTLIQLGGLQQSPLKFIFFFKEDFLLTLSAQIMSMPILFYTFGSYSLVSLPVNLLVLWVIPPLMMFGGIAAVISFITPSIGSIILLLSVPFLYYFEWVVGMFSSAPSVIELKMSIISILGYYFLLSSIFLFTRVKKEE